MMEDDRIEAAWNAAEQAYEHPLFPGEDATLVPIDASVAPLIALGLASAGVSLESEHIIGQSAQAVANQYAPSDPVTLGALTTYITFLRFMIEHPDHWSLESRDLPQILSSFGGKWYRQAKDRAEHADWIPHEEVRARMHAIDRQDPQGTLVVPYQSTSSDPEIDTFWRHKEPFVIAAEDAEPVADQLLRLGFAIDKDSLAGQQASRLARELEPQDPLARQNLQNAIVLSAIHWRLMRRIIRQHEEGGQTT